MYRRKQFMLGVKSGIPVMIGFIPIAFTFATLALHTGLNITETNLMSILVLAGASQMMAVNMLALGAGLFEIIIATFILNLRHLIMSICVMNRLKNAPLSLKLLLSFGVTDETFAILSTKPQKQCNEYYFAGLATTTYLSWVIGTVVGSIVSQFLPQMVLNSMSISLYAMFIGLLIPNIKHNIRIGLIVLIGICINVVLTNFMASGWSIIISILISSYLGTYIEKDTEEELLNASE